MNVKYPIISRCNFVLKNHFYPHLVQEISENCYLTFFFLPLISCREWVYQVLLQRFALQPTLD